MLFAPTLAVKVLSALKVKDICPSLMPTWPIVRSACFRQHWRLPHRRPFAAGCPIRIRWQSGIRPCPFHAGGAFTGYGIYCFSMFSLFNKSFRDCAWLSGAISNAAMSICQKTNLFILVVTVMIWN